MLKSSSPHDLYMMTLVTVFSCNMIFFWTKNCACVGLDVTTLRSQLSVMFYQTTWSEFFQKVFIKQQGPFHKKIIVLAVLVMVTVSIKHPAVDIWKKSLLNHQHYLFFKF